MQGHDGREYGGRRRRQRDFVTNFVTGSCVFRRGLQPGRAGLGRRGLGGRPGEHLGRHRRRVRWRGDRRRHRLDGRGRGVLRLGGFGLGGFGGRGTVFVTCPWGGGAVGGGGKAGELAQDMQLVLGPQVQLLDMVGRRVAGVAVVDGQRHLRGGRGQLRGEVARLAPGRGAAAGLGAQMGLDPDLGDRRRSLLTPRRHRCQRPRHLHYVPDRRDRRGRSGQRRVRRHRERGRGGRRRCCRAAGVLAGPVGLGLAGP